MSEKTPKFISQISPPEQPLERPNPLTVNEGEPFESAVGQCQDIVETKAANILHATMQDMADRISNLSNVEDSGIINNIELLQSALFGLFQKIKFEQYDLEYGFEDHENQVSAPLTFSGDSFEALKFLEGVAWITEAANASLARLNKDIQDLEAIIARAKVEKDELDDEPHNKRERAKLQSTIDSRTSRKKKKIVRCKALVKAINNFLRVDTEDQEALWQEAEKLLTFMAQNEYVQQETTTEKAQYINSIPKSLLINKKIIPEPKTPREKVQYERVKKKKKPRMTTRNIVLLTALGLLTLGAASSPLLKSYLKQSTAPQQQLLKKPYTNPQVVKIHSIKANKKLIRATVENLLKKIDKLTKQIRVDSKPELVDKIRALQLEVEKLNKKYNLGMTIANEIRFPRKPIDSFLNKVHYDVDIEFFKDLVVENSYMAIGEILRYRDDFVLEDHVVGKLLAFSRRYTAHPKGIVKIDAKINALDEKTITTKLEHAIQHGKPGKLVQINTTVDVELTFVGAINETIKKTMLVAGVRFVPDVPKPKTYQVKTLKGPAFLTMEQLKRLNLRPGDYVPGQNIRIDADGIPEIVIQ